MPQMAPFSWILLNLYFTMILITTMFFFHWTLKMFSPMKSNYLLSPQFKIKW